MRTLWCPAPWPPQHHLTLPGLCRVVCISSLLPASLASFLSSWSCYLRVSGLLYERLKPGLRKEKGLGWRSDRSGVWGSSQQRAHPTQTPQRHPHPHPLPVSREVLSSVWPQSSPFALRSAETDKNCNCGLCCEAHSSLTLPCPWPAESPHPELHGERGRGQGASLPPLAAWLGGVFWRPPGSSHGLAPQGAPKWWVSFKNHGLPSICQL